MNDNAKKICKILMDYNIPINIYEHQPVYTVEDVKNAELNIPGIPTKNLFLRSKDKRKYFLYISQEDKRVEFKELAKFLGVKGITFASKEDLHRILNLELGDVGPFGIIHDKERIVQVLIDSGLKNSKKINLSANSLSTTLTIDYEYLIQFIEKNGSKYEIVDFQQNSGEN